MQMSYEILRKRVSSFNRKAHISKDFHKIRNIYKCDYAKKLLMRKGYYVSDGSGDYIFVDKRLSGAEKLEVQFHEMTHLLLDYPCDFMEFRQHIHAQVFSLIFLIPKKDILEYSEMNLEEIDYRLHPFLSARWQILQKFGI